MGTQYSIAPYIETDCCEWNGFVLNHPQGHRLQTSYWAQTKVFTGWNIHYLSARQDGKLVGGAQLYERRLPLIGSLVCLPKGPICSSCGADILPDLEFRLGNGSRTPANFVCLYNRRTSPNILLNTSLLKIMQSCQMRISFLLEQSSLI